MLRDTLGRSSSISFSTSSATPLVSRHCEPLCPSLEQRGCRAAERQNVPGDRAATGQTNHPAGPKRRFGPPNSSSISRVLGSKRTGYHQVRSMIAVFDSLSTHRFDTYSCCPDGNTYKSVTLRRGNQFGGGLSVVVNVEGSSVPL